LSIVRRFWSDDVESHMKMSGGRTDIGRTSGKRCEDERREDAQWDYERRKDERR